MIVCLFLVAFAAVLCSLVRKKKIESTTQRSRTKQIPTTTVQILPLKGDGDTKDPHTITHRLENSRIQRNEKKVVWESIGVMRWIS